MNGARCCASSRRPFICCKAIVPAMLKQGYGRIVTRLDRRQEGIQRRAYSASKSGLIALTKRSARTGGHDILGERRDAGRGQDRDLDQLTQQHIDFMLSKIRKTVS